MNKRLQAGVELIFEKQATLEQESSLSHVLRQKLAIDSNIVKTNDGTGNGNEEAGKNDETEEPTIEGGDCIKGLTISSDYNNAKTASTRRRGQLAHAIQRMAHKQAYISSDPTQTDGMAPAKDNDVPDLKGVKTPAGGVSDASESEAAPDATAEQSQKSAAQVFIEHMAKKAGHYGGYGKEDKNKDGDSMKSRTEEPGGTETNLVAGQKEASQRRVALISLVSNLR